MKQSDEMSLSVDLPIRNGRLARHPIIYYFLLSFGFSWLLATPTVMGQDGLGLLPFSVPMPWPLVLFLVGVAGGPMLAALVVTRALNGGDGLRQLLRQSARWRARLGWYVLAFLGYPLLYTVVGSVLLGPTVARAVVRDWAALFTVYLPTMLVFSALVAWGQEVGWRGLALARSQETYGPLLGSLLVGLGYGLWYLPVFLIVKGPVALGPFDPGLFVLNTLGMMAISIIGTWIFNSSRGSIPMMALVHASSLAVQGWLGQVVPGWTIQADYTMMAVLVVMAIGLVAATKGRLGFRWSVAPPLPAVTIVEPPARAGTRTAALARRPMRSVRDVG
jgi:uncharacterized protein